MPLASSSSALHLIRYFFYVYRSVGRQCTRLLYMLQGQTSQLTMAAAAASELVGSERDRKWRNQRKWKSNRKNSICNCARESGKFEMDFAIFARWMHTVALSRAALESNEPAARGEKSKFNVKSNLLFADALNHRRRWGAADGGEGAAKKNHCWIWISSRFPLHASNKWFNESTWHSNRTGSHRLLSSLLCWKATSIL